MHRQFRNKDGWVMLGRICLFLQLLIQMSIITANNSLVDYQARTKSNSRHFRNYQRVSQSNLDQSAIAAYLRSRNLHRTLSTFLSQSNRKRTVTPILEIFIRGGQKYTGTAEQYWQIIQRAIVAQNKGLSSKEIETRKVKMTKLELYIHIWHCITENGTHPERVNILKQFITAKGSTLSENPQLLPYFALPYVQKVATHSFLKKVFSEAWRNQVKNLLQELIKAEGQVDTMEQEWFNIITDLIEICEQLAKQIRIDANNAHLKAMIERVKLYKTVVEQNQTEKRLVFEQEKIRKQSQLKGTEQIDLSNMKQVKSRLIKLNEQLVQSKNHKCLAEMMAIYSKIEMQVSERYKKGSDKQYVALIIEKDLLLLKNKSTNISSHLEWLKLVQIMSSYFKSRSYFAHNHSIVNKMVELIEKWYLDAKIPNRIELIYIGFDILQKLIVRRQLFQIANSSQILPKIAIDLIYQYQLQFQKSKETSILFQVILVWTVNTVMHRKGRARIARTPLFQTLVGILNRLPNMDNSLTIQSLICSIIYLLLVEQQIRKTALKLNLKDILLKRMMNKKNESYDSIVQYIIQRIENDQEEQEIDSDEDVQKEQQFDQNVSLCLADLKSDNVEVALAIKDGNSGVVNLPKRKQEYKSERYSWKRDK